MRSKWAWVPLVVVLGVAMYAGTVLATPPSSVKPTVFGVGAFGPIETKGTIGAWSAQMKTTRATDIHVLQTGSGQAGALGGTAIPGRAS